MSPVDFILVLLVVAAGCGVIGVALAVLNILKLDRTQSSIVQLEASVERLSRTVEDLNGSVR